MKKVYTTLFTCGVTRAIHLELVPDLSAETFKQTLKKFTARRGTPSLMVSDNAKTFEATAGTPLYNTSCRKIISDGDSICPWHHGGEDFLKGWLAWLKGR